jgi:hypothetical protein
MQLVTVVCCCKSACFQVSIIWKLCIKRHCFGGICGSYRDFNEGSFVLGYFAVSIGEYE